MEKKEISNKRNIYFVHYRYHPQAKRFLQDLPNVSQCCWTTLLLHMGTKATKKRKMDHETYIILRHRIIYEIPIFVMKCVQPCPRTGDHFAMANNILESPLSPRNSNGALMIDKNENIQRYSRFLLQVSSPS